MVYYFRSLVNRFTDRGLFELFDIISVSDCRLVIYLPSYFYSLRLVSARSKDFTMQERDEDDKEQRSQSLQEPVVEVFTPEVYSNSGAGSSADPFSGIWSRKLRVKIIGREGSEKLDVRIPVSHTLYANTSMFVQFIVHAIPKT